MPDQYQHNPLDDAVARLIKARMDAKSTLLKQQIADTNSTLAGRLGGSDVFRTAIAGASGFTRGLGVDPLLPKDVRDVSRSLSASHPFASRVGEFAGYGAELAAGAGVFKGVAGAAYGAEGLVGAAARTGVLAASAGAVGAVHEGISAAAGETYVAARPKPSPPFDDQYMESDFGAWYGNLARTHGLDPNPDNQSYDYRALWYDLKSGLASPKEIPAPGEQKAWPVDYTTEGHQDYDQSPGAWRPAKGAKEIAGNIASRAVKDAATMAVLAPVTSVLGTLGSAVARRTLPNAALDVMASRPFRALISEPAQMGAVNAGLAVASGAPLSDIPEAYAVGHIGGLLTQFKPFGKGTPRGANLDVALGEALADIELDPFTAEGRKALREEVQSRITVGSRRLTPDELITLHENAKKYRYEMMGSTADGLHEVFASQAEKIASLQESQMDAESALESHLAEEPPKAVRAKKATKTEPARPAQKGATKVERLKWRQKKTELEQTLALSTKNAKEAHQRMELAHNHLVELAKEAADRIIKENGSRDSIMAFERVIGKDETLWHKALEGGPLESLLRPQEGEGGSIWDKERLPATVPKRLPPPDEASYEFEAARAKYGPMAEWKAKLERIKAKLAAVEDTPESVKHPRVRRNKTGKIMQDRRVRDFTYLGPKDAEGRTPGGPVGRYRSTDIISIGNQVDASLDRRIVARKTPGQGTIWEIQVRDKGADGKFHWRLYAEVKRRKLGEGVVSAEPAEFNQFWHTARRIIGQTPEGDIPTQYLREKQQVDRLNEELDQHLENKPPDMPADVAEEAVAIARRVREGGFAAVPSFKELVKAIREKIIRRRAEKPLDERIREGSISERDARAQAAARVEIDRVMGEESAKEDASGMSQGDRTRRVFAMGLWPARGLSERMEDIGPEGLKFQTYSKIFKPVTDALDMMNTTYRNMMYSRVQNGIYPQLKRAGLGRLGRADREQLFNYLEDPSISLSGKNAGKIRHVAGVMRTIFDDLFVKFNIPRYRKNYITHIQEQSFRDRQELGDVGDIEFSAEKPRADVIRDFVKDPAEIIAKYVRGGLKKQFLKSPVEIANGQVKLIGGTSENAARYWKNFLNMATGGVTDFERKINESVQAMAQTIRNVTGAQWATRLAEDPFAASRFSSVLTRLAYVRYLGFKPASALRNLTQINLAASELGVSHVLRAFKQITKDGWVNTLTDMKNSGIGIDFLSGMDLPVGYGRVANVLDAATDVALKLFSTADLVNRAITYKAAEIRFNDGVRKYGKAMLAGDRSALSAIGRELLLTGKGSRGRVTERQSPALRRSIMGKLKEGNVEAAQKEYAKYFVEKWQFRYGKTGTPQSFQNSLGRIISQFGTWPVFYAHGLGRTIKPALQGDLAALKMPISWLIQSNMILLAGAWLGGMDLSSWFGGDLYKKNFTIGDEEYTLVPPTGPLNWGPGPLANPVLDLMDSAIAIASGQDRKLQGASRRLLGDFFGDRPLMAAAEAIGTPEAVTRSVDLALSVGATGNLMDRDGKTVAFIDMYDRTLLALGFKPTSLSKAKHAMDSEKRSLRLEEQKQKRQVRSEIQRDLGNQPWIKTAGAGQVAGFIRKHYPTATWLMNPGAIHSILRNLQTTALERAEKTNERYFRNPHNRPMLKGILK